MTAKQLKNKYLWIDTIVTNVIVKQITANAAENKLAF